MAITTYQANRVNNFLFGATSLTPNATYYIGLSTTAISADGTGISEPSGGGYARIPVTNNKNTFTDSSGGLITNKIQISYNESTTDWGTIRYIFISDASTGGNILYFDQLTNPRNVQLATTLIFSAGSIRIQIT